MQLDIPVSFFFLSFNIFIILRIYFVKARVDRIHVEGVARTKDDILNKALRELFTATNFQEVMLYTHKARVRLESLYCFRNISVYIDVSKGPKSTKDGLEVRFIFTLALSSIF